MQFRDYYEIMGLSRSATPEELKRAYRKLARRYHPDVSKEKNAEERFKEINEAYEVLKDPEKRRAYDQLGADWKAGQDFRPPPDWQGGFDFGGGGYTRHDASEFSEFFEALFGARPGGATGGRGRRFRRTHGGDQHSKLVIGIEDSYAGAVRELTLRVSDPGASGGYRTRTLKVAVPRGVVEGQQIRIAGQGGAGGDGAPAGDLYLEVHFAPHPQFRLEGRDVYASLPITPWEAALGAKVPVPTLGGRVEMAVPAGAQSGQTLRLKGRGLPAAEPGDQYVVLKVVVPRPRNDKERAIYEQMRREMDFDPRAEGGG